MNFKSVIIIMIFLAAAFTSGCGKQKAEDTAAKSIPVITTPSRIMTFEASLSVSGNIVAKNYALVSARVGGTLDAVFVDEGDRVEAGITELFQVDSVKLSRAVEIARQGLEVAESSLRESKARLKSNEADFAQKQADLRRHRNLHEKGITSPHDLEVKEAEYKKSESNVEHSRALIDLAEARVRQAKSALTIAEKDLADSRAVAPISGTVTQRLLEPGEMAAPGAPVLKIEDLSVVEISAFLPEEYYSRVVPGQTIIRVRCGNQDLGEHPITFRSPVVDPTLRTFEIKCEIELPPEGVVPGRIALVTPVFERRRAVGVPLDSVIIRSGQPCVFVIENGQAKRKFVSTGLKTAGWIEITGKGLASGVPVISTGQDFIEDGTPVRIVKETK